MIRILASHHTMPNITSVTTIFFQNLLPILKTKTDVHVTWVIYKPERLGIIRQNDADTTILDIHDYKNMVEIIQKTKPDIIYVWPYSNVLDYALAIAGKFLNIPMIGHIVNEFTTKKDNKSGKSYLKHFFQSSIPTDTYETRKQFMKRGRFFIYKYLFLLRTQIAIKMKISKILENFFMILKMYFLETDFDKPNTKFGLSLYFLESERIIDTLLKTGFERSNLVVTGNPMYDSIFQKIQKIQPSIKNDNKIRVLLLTIGMYEHGHWTRRQRDSIVKNIIMEITKHKNKMSLVVKIHPSSEILSEYESLIRSIDSSVPVHQEGDVIEFLQNSDVVLAWASNTALTYSLILKKPIIMCNFFNLQGDVFLERGLVSECKELSTLVPLIESAWSSNPTASEKIDDFISEFFYKSDGQASERISNEIIKLLK